MSYYEQAKRDLASIKRKPTTRLKKIWGYIWFGAPLFIVGGVVGSQFRGIESGVKSAVLPVAIVLLTAGVMVFINYHLQAFSRRRQSFYRELDTILPGKRKGLGRTNAHHLLEIEPLSQMSHRPTRSHEAIVYYSHIGAALVNEGQFEEAVQIAQLLKEQADDFYTRGTVNELNYYINTILAKPLPAEKEQTGHD